MQPPPCSRTPAEPRNSSSPLNQGAQYSLIKEYTLNPITGPFETYTLIMLCWTLWVRPGRKGRLGAERSKTFSDNLRLKIKGLNSLNPKSYSRHRKVFMFGYDTVGDKQVILKSEIFFWPHKRNMAFEGLYWARPIYGNCRAVSRVDNPP